MGLNNKSRSIGQYIIDLTPLLDVIFILLMVVLCYSEDHIEGADKKFEEAQQIEQSAKADMEAKNVQLQASEDSVNSVVIYAYYDPSNRKRRTLSVIINTGEPVKWEINNTNQSRVWEDCKLYIEENLQKTDTVPTIISIPVKDEKMLYRDEVSIKDLYEKLNIKNKYLSDKAESNDE